ncbi:protein kinase [Micromonospora sp. WMMD961]|uniref:serine/threonine-protein kinase n=1 Tax=Micromonospora sp. WMMD961 TaxID=3016100 RepID=UPI002417039B|nr:serine/threonine-protein kinase [Micromonospora sp. WMMD961]MDG4780890.1 protein kinase [Micromonospora sp. WMMD961]
MPNVGQVVGDRYRLVESIASGGMGDVWRAVDETLDRCVAVKMLQSRLVADAGFGERFRREARAMAALRHPGVAQVYDYGEVSEPDALAYIVMECVQGQPLSERIAEVGRLGVAETMSIAAQTAGALQAAHDAGVVHRDVKPSNLVIEPDGHVVLVDFGVAVTQEAASLTGTNQVVGTALYMAPEQVTRNETTPAIDIYALGAVVYHCLAGRPPHQGENAVAVALRHLQEEPPPLPADVPEAVRRLVDTAMAKQPAHRFPTAAAMATAAQTLADSSDQSLPTVVAASGTAVTAPLGAPIQRTDVPRPVVGSVAKRSGVPGPKGLAVLLGSMVAAAAVLVFADPTGMMPGRTGQPSTPPAVSPPAPSQRDPGPGGGGGDPANSDSAGLPVRATGSPTPTPSGSAGPGTVDQSTPPGESTEGGATPTPSESAPTDPTAAPTGGTTAAPTESSSEEPAEPEEEPAAPEEEPAEPEEPEEEAAADPTRTPPTPESAAETSAVPQV